MCKNAKHPDLHSYRRHEHAAILLDEVAGPKFIVENKKLLQAHVDGALLGQSPTQQYTYEVFLWRTPIMLTTNSWDLSGLTAAELDWVRSNCVAIHVPEPVYSKPPVPQPLAAPQPPPQAALPVPPQEQMAPAAKRVRT